MRSTRGKEGLIRMELPLQTGPPFSSQNVRSRKLRLLAIGLGGAVLLGVFVLALLFVIFGSIRSSPVSRTAVERARANPDVVNAIGSPLETGWWVSGSISVTGPSGQADLAIPLTGPRGRGTLYLRAQKVAGEWEYKLLEFGVQGQHDHIQLLTSKELGGV
jgi:hypothetical protein